MNQTFTMQKDNLQKTPLKKKSQNPSRKNNSCIFEFQVSKQAKIIIFQKSSYKNRPK
jgi:hypothetical protein